MTLAVKGDTRAVFSFPSVPPSLPAPIRTITVPSDGRYMQLIDDWDTAQWGYMARSRFKNYKDSPPWNGLPATVQTQKTFYALNREWQLFFFDLCRRYTMGTFRPDELLKDYQQYSRDSGGWRDQHTWNNWREDSANPPVPLEQQKIFTDYVLRRNLPPAHTEGDAMQQDLLSSGNIVKVIGEGQVGGESAWVIETLDHTLYDVPTAGASPVAINGRTKYLKDPPAVGEVFGKWHLVGFATVSAYRWPDEEYPKGMRARFRWPGFGGYGAPHMNIGRGGQNRVPKFWCRPVENGAELDLYKAG